MEVTLMTESGNKLNRIKNSNVSSSNESINLEKLKNDKDKRLERARILFKTPPYYCTNKK